MTILVTGGAGYIGSQACKALKKAKFLPIAYDNLSQGHKSAVKWGPLIHADICNKRRLKQAFLKHKPMAVIHFAGSALVGESVENPSKYYVNNVTGSTTLLETMLEHNVKLLIFSSSCATYGKPLSIPISESHPQKPVNPYGYTKLIIEQMIKDFEKAYGFKFAILRYFNAAGADLEAEIGENHYPETHLVPNMLKAMLSNKNLEIYGSDFDTEDGSAIRDYVHVVDLADAHVKALKWLLNENKSLELNLGTGKGFSVLEMVQNAEKLFNKKIKFKLTKRRSGDPSILIADPQLSRKILNWQPQFSSLETILKSAYLWHKNL